MNCDVHAHAEILAEARTAVVYPLHLCREVLYNRLRLPHLSI
jgi:hypothetical protein